MSVRGWQYQIKVHLTLSKPTAEGIHGESMWAAVSAETAKLHDSDDSGTECLAELLNTSVLDSRYFIGQVIVIRTNGKMKPEIVRPVQ